MAALKFVSIICETSGSSKVGVTDDVSKEVRYSFIDQRTKDREQKASDISLKLDQRNLKVEDDHYVVSSVDVLSASWFDLL